MNLIIYIITANTHFQIVFFNFNAMRTLQVIFACGSSLQYDEQGGLVILDDKLQINISSPMIWKFRILLDDLIQRKIKTPRFRFTKSDETILETFDNILSAEDSSKGLFHPPGVGDRPLFISNRMTEYNPAPNEGITYIQTFSAAERVARLVNQRGDNPVVNLPRHARHPYRPVPHNRSNYNGHGHQQARNDQRQPSCSRASNACQRRLSENEEASAVLINAIAPKNIAIPHNARFFVIRPTEIRNIIISVSQGTWNFSPQTEKKIFRLFRVTILFIGSNTYKFLVYFLQDGFFIVLLFTVRGTNYFQGVARLLDTNRGQPNVPCPIEWLGTNSVSYDDVR